MIGRIGPSFGYWVRLEVWIQNGSGLPLLPGDPVLTFSIIFDFNREFFHISPEILDIVVSGIIFHGDSDFSPIQFGLLLSI